MSNAKNNSTVIPFRRKVDHIPHKCPDTAHYENLLTEFDLTPEQRKAFFEALWILVSGFIDFGTNSYPARPTHGLGNLNELILETVDEYFKVAA